MFCKNCGTEIKQGDAFCGACGTKVEEPVVKEPVQQRPKKEPIKIPKKSLMIGGVVLLVLIVAITTISVITSQVSLKKYIAEELTFEGVNGYGYIGYEYIDYDGLENALFGKGDVTEDDLKGMSQEEIFGFIFGGADVNDHIDVTVSENARNRSLSNGDIVTVTIVADYESINNLPGIKKKLVGKDKITIEYTVEGLKEATKVNVFEVISKVYVDKTKNSVSVDLNQQIQHDNFSIQAALYDGYYNAVNIEVSYPSVEQVGETDYINLSISLSSSNYNSDTNKVALSIDIDPTKYIGSGIVFEPASMEFDANTVDYAKSLSSLSSNSLSLLKSAALGTKVDEGYELSTALFIVNPNRDNGYYAISYLFKGTNGYQVVYFDNNSLVVDGNGDLCYSDKLTGTAITEYVLFSGRQNRVFESIDSYKAYLGEGYTFETITL